MDRRLGDTPHLEILRAADGAEPVEPAAVLLPTRYGAVKVDVLEVRQAEMDRPSDDPGDRLQAAAHAWVSDSATDLTIEVANRRGEHVEVTTPVAEPGPLIAMKLQAVMNRSVDKQGTDLLDIVRLAVDRNTRPVALPRSPALPTPSPATSPSTSSCGSYADASKHSNGSGTLLGQTSPRTISNSLRTFSPLLPNAPPDHRSAEFPRLLRRDRLRCAEATP